MTEHPILFSAPMVRAILEGRKTQTRRVMKTQPECQGALMNSAGGDLIYLWPHKDVEYYCKCPHGKIRSSLWVRETHCFVADQFAITPGVAYKADGSIRWLKSLPNGTTVYNENDPYGWKWRPSIFMPRWASRITLEIVNVRVERVQEISEDDAVSEGMEPKEPNHVVSAQYRFAQLWNSINTARGYGWDVNPWVWVIEFKKVGQS